jgi:hypothetical protein
MTAEESSPRPPALVRLLLDAYDAADRVIAALPAPGRGGAIGRLNSGGWIVAHLADQQDRLWNVAVQSQPRDQWLAAHAEALRPGAEPSAPPFEEAAAAWARIVERARPCLLQLDEPGLAASVPGRERTVEEMLALSAAHLYVHAGELSAIASLVGAPEIVLPGVLTHSFRPQEDQPRR